MDRNYPYYYYNKYYDYFYRRFLPPRKIGERCIQRFYGSYPIFRDEASIRTFAAGQNIYFSIK